MNLYIFNESSRAAVFGIGTYIRELTAALRNSHIKVFVVHLKSDKPQIQTEEMDGISHLYFPDSEKTPRTTDFKKQNELYYRSVVYLLRLRIEDNRGLIFHLNYNQSDKLAEELKKKFDCRIIMVVHYSNWGFSIYDNLERLRNILKEGKPEENFKKSIEEEKSYYSNVDRVVCLSNYMQEILCSDYKIDVKKISVISNGLTDIAESKTTVNDLRKKWNLPIREKIILFVGRMDEVKGLAYLLKAFREVLQFFPKCRLVIAGNGSYDRYTKESQDICTHIIYTGLLEKDQLYEWYRIADMGIVPSLFEPFGYVAVEMMMHELPIVATVTSGLNEVVDETCGLKVPLTIHPESVEIDTTLLAEKILYMLQHPAEARKMGRNGRKKYLKEYSSEVFRQNMFQFYESLYQ